MNDVRAELEAIRARNVRVEADKAWEMSCTRRAFIAMVTFLAAALFLHLAGASQVLLPSLIPAVGYAVSTLSLPPLKRLWMRRMMDDSE